MYLKGLELQGFKSFPDRIRLDFNKGITAVVGPNGSGKSNISDAVRWVLGEKSAKTLRGAKMEDIIFSGTADRKPMGFAEVTLIMDNGDKVLNVDYSEVSVTRKVYRTGDSEYLINGRTCRQRDILELFMDTGVGKEGYSIIGQGRIDEILSSKSEDRRNLFEEAAGIVKYKARCAEAQNNLEHTQTNLIRINDILSELTSQVGPLEKQAEKTKRYRILYDRLKNIQISIFVEDADRYEQDIKLFDEQLNNLKSDIETSRSEQTRLEENKEKFRERLNSINSELDEAAQRLTERRAEAEKRSGDIRLCNNDAEHISGRIALAKKDIAHNLTEIENAQQSLTELDARLNSKKIELGNKTETYEKRRAELENVSRMLSAGEEKINRYNEQMFERLNRRNELNARVSELNAVLKQYEESDKNSNDILSGYDGRIEQTKTALAAEKLEAEGIELEGKTITENMSALTAENDRIKVITADKNKEQQAVLKNISEKNSRLRVLTEFKRDYEGYYGGVKAVLKLRDSGTKGFEGIKGAVGEVITMPSELETAIEIALGGAVQNIIADTEENVKTAINYLKQNRLGRATFLPMNAVKGRTLGADKYKLTSAKGVIGIAKELISYDSKYEGVMSSLLERVIVVDNIDNGILLARQTKYAYKIVTLDGDLFNAGGSMTGGSTAKKNTGIFSRTREITELENALTALQTDRTAISDELNRLTSRADDITESLNEARDEIQRLAIAKREHSVKIDHIQDELNTLEEEKAAHIARMAELGKNLANAREQAEKTAQSLTAVNDEIEEIKTKTAEFNSELKTQKETRDTGNEEIILMSGELNRIKGEYNALNTSIERTKADILSLYDKNEQLENSISLDKQTILTHEQDKARLEAEAKRIEQECKEIANKQTQLADEKSKTTALSDEYERRIRSILQSISGLENESTRIGGKREQTELKSRELYDRMFETYEITYVAAKSAPPLELKYEAKKREEAKLKGEIRQLGSVNVNAIEEYEAVKQRFDQYTAQQADIIDTEHKLKEIIAQLQALMEVQFKEQFKVISQNFSRVFAEMFGGGKASLKLSDENDVLNCGIDIEAQPPGKALQNMTLLSGGEKAMTAISLLFSILEMKPSPFCILDEIEAALDDANVVRFAEYLRNFTDTTQFIVITHRPGTREVADTLYGVTQDRGISKLFSTNIEEIMKERENSGTV